MFLVEYQFCAIFVFNKFFEVLYGKQKDKISFVETSHKFIIANISINQYYQHCCSNDLTDPSIRIVSFATINLRGLCTKQKL